MMLPGSCWKLSGASHWSPGPTKVSKKSQVRRARCRSVTRSDGDSGSLATSCALMRRAISGERIQRRRVAPQGSTEGRPIPSIAPAQVARATASHLSPEDASGALCEGASRVGGCHPLKQVLAGDRHADDGAHDRVGRDPRFVREKHDTQRPAAQGPPAIVVEERRSRDGQRNEQWSEHQRLGAAEEGPAKEEEREQGRGEEAPPQVVGDLPAVDDREAVRHQLLARGRDEGKDPRKQLPVSADPSVQATSEGQVVLWVLLEDDDVGGEGGPSVDAFEKVVAGQGVLGDPPFEAAHERVDFVDTLSDVRPGTERVLIHVRGCAGIDVERRIAAPDPAEKRRGTIDRRGFDPGLGDGVSRGNPPASRVEPCGMERMSGKPDELAHRTERELGVGVERNDEANASQARSIAKVVLVARRRVAPQEAIELLELASFALPSHEAALSRAPSGFAVQDVKGSLRRRLVFRVELADDFLGVRQNICVVRQDGRVSGIAQQHECKGRIRTGQIVKLELSEQAVEVLATRDESGYHDHGAAIRRHPLGEIALRERPRAEKPAHPPDGQCDGDRDDREDQQGAGDSP